METFLLLLLVKTNPAKCTINFVSSHGMRMRIYTSSKAILPLPTPHRIGQIVRYSHSLLIESSKHRAIRVRVILRQCS